MLTIQPAKYRPRRRPLKEASVDRFPPLAGTPVLVAAVYDPVGLTLTLTFDRAINISGVDGTQINVNDPATSLYLATGDAVLVNAGTVQLGLNVSDVPSGTQVLLNTGLTGIDSVVDGMEWGDVTDVVLPFP